MKHMNWLLAIILFFAAARAEARPYYAAMKGKSCAACHVAPAGGGMRKPTEGSPGRLTDNVSLGGDLRFFFSRTESSNVSGFTLGRTAAYLLVQPRPDLEIALQHHLDEVQTAQAYGIWRAQGGLPIYVKAGRFWLPYGIQWDDPDNSRPLLTAPFAPGAGFNMAATASDTGLEIGLAPKENYFLNLAVTNGKPAGGGDNNDRKAVTARAGFIRERFMLGASFYQDEAGPSPADSDKLRFGPLAWFRLGGAALIYEGGFGTDDPNAAGSSIKMRAHAAELDLELSPGWLGKLLFDRIDPNTRLSGDKKTRFSFGLERSMAGLAVELQYRLKRESPRISNDEVFLQAHAWF